MPAIVAPLTPPKTKHVDEPKVGDDGGHERLHVVRVLCDSALGNLLEHHRTASTSAGGHREHRKEGCVGQFYQSTKNILKNSLKNDGGVEVRKDQQANHQASEERGPCQRLEKAPRASPLGLLLLLLLLLAALCHAC
jgi:hypothetical protein